MNPIDLQSVVERTQAARLDALRIARVLDEAAHPKHPRQADAIRHARNAACALAGLTEALEHLADDAAHGAADREHGEHVGPEPSVSTETPEPTGWTGVLEPSEPSGDSAGSGMPRRGIDRQNHENAGAGDWWAR